MSDMETEFEKKLLEILCNVTRHENNHTTGISVQKGVSEIIEAVKSLVPEEKEEELDPTHYGGVEWNQCRSEILKRLGGK